MNKLKKSALLICLLFSTQLFSQNKVDDKQLIQEVVNNFKSAINSKDLSSFLTLFIEESKVSWVGKGSRGEQFGSPSGFISMLQSSKDTMREDFHNIEIWNDEFIAVVTFDYGFFINDNISNWGKESWMLIKQNDQWKITSVNFSMIMARQKEYPFQN